MGTDDSFVDRVADRLATLPTVEAVALGGFDPQTLRDIGWPGEVSEIGAWGGVFNGGAWLQIEDRRVDVHYRDLDTVEYELGVAG